MSVRLRIAALTAVLAALAGCAGSPARQTPLMTEIEGLDIGSRELQIVVYDYAAHLSTVIEVTADAIHERSSDPEVRRNAVLWKLNAIPAAYRAAFHADPLVAFLDCWALAAQMTRHLETGAGRDLFGSEQPLAVAAAHRLERDAAEIGRTLIGKADPRIEIGVYMWVDANPVTERQFVRESGAAIFARDTSPIRGGLSATGEMNQQMREMQDRMALYAENAPRQVRWQSELLLEDVGDILARERAATLADLGTRADALLSSLLDHRQTILHAMTLERTAMLEGISKERLATLEAVAQEREIALAALHEERLAALRDLDAISKGFLDEADSRSVATMDRLLDRAMKRLAVPAAAGFALGIAGVGGLWLVALRRRP